MYRFHHFLNHRICRTLGLAVTLVIAFGSQVRAEDNSAEGKQRCSIRVNASLTKQLPTAELLKAANPKANVDALLVSPAFIESFSSFINSSFNEEPGATPSLDTPYHLAKFVLTNKKPWADVFTGLYDLKITTPGPTETVEVVESPTGLGYFRVLPWKIRYAGNEPAGIRLVAAYRILHDITGLKLVATTNAPGADVSAAGRQSPACASCHYDNWSALDKTASVLGKVNVGANATTFVEPDGVPKSILDGVMIKDDRELVEALVKSENFSFNTCRLVFSFLYGRGENSCEGKVFDQCVDAFKKSGMIQDAIKSVVNDTSFCQ